MTTDPFPQNVNSDFQAPTGYSANLDLDYKAHPELKDLRVVGVDGSLYDVSTFAKYHPGGEELLNHFVGKDVSIQVRAFHERDVMEGRSPVGTYVDTTDKDPAAKGYKQLTEQFRKEGLFKTSYTWYAGKFVFAFSFLALCVHLINSDRIILAAGALALFWQQCGFFMHDFMHSQLTHNRHKDRWYGMLFGTAGIGVGGHWWKAEHFIHHALTNTVDLKTGWSDPQMREDVWVQSRKMFPLYQKCIDPYLIKIQQYTWLPLTVFFGRIGIAVDCFREEKRWYEWAAFAAHWMYLACIMSLIPTWEQRGIFYLAASIGQGVLSVQLLISHYARPFFLKDTEYHNTSWPRVQTITTINIVNHPLLDWFHGGLNIHIEHHLFPCMPRHNFRKIQPIIKQYCKDVGLEYFEATWTETITMTITHLAAEARAYKKL